MSTSTPTASDGKASQISGSLTPLHQPVASAHLKSLSTVALTSELLARLRSGDAYGGHVMVAEQLRQVLSSAIDIHQNRFSARRLNDNVTQILRVVPMRDLRGKTVVDLGCGSLNPFTISFALLMLGAERAYALDLDPVQDVNAAVRAMAAAAGWLLTEPARIVGQADIRPEDVLRNLRGFQLPMLAAGDPIGIDARRLEHRCESIYDLTLAEGEADVVFSVSVFEHLERVDDAVESLRRVTRPGGVGLHVVDFADHRIYAEYYGVTDPLEFLKSVPFEPAEQMHWSNRVRCDEMCATFERHGFHVEGVELSPGAGERRGPGAVRRALPLNEPQESGDRRRAAFRQARVTGQVAQHHADE